MSSFSGAQLGRSNLFSQPRKVSFDHEVELSRKKANANSTITSKAVCCGCRRKPRRLTKTPSDPEKNEETGSATKEPTVIYSFKLDRLKLAIKHEQKKFVAHPHCQHLLTTLWYDQLPGWRKRHPCTKVFLCFCFIIAMPILAPVYLLHPRGRVGLVLRSPLIKFINHSASFAIFIILLLIASTDSSTDQYLNDRSAIRGPNPNSIELLILWWVMGFVWSEMKQIWEEGFKAYVRQWWNWLDFVMLGLYLTTVALRLVALWLRLTDAYGTEPTPRTEWPADDPTLLSEALFSIAHIFSFARIIFLFQVNEHLGPLQISLGNMLIDITKFIFIFLLVISSFACGLHQLYYYYVSSEGDFRPDAFKSLVRSYRTLFWNLFGNSQPDHFKVRILNETTGKREDLPSARSTVIVGEILLLIYHAMAIIVLINMLIAMMSNSFQTIQNHADTEWKFARSKLWVGYFDEGSTLPPPLNTIISPKSIFRAFAGVYHLFRYCFKRCSLGWHQSGPERHHVSVAWDDCDKRPCDSDLGKVWSSSGPSQTPDYHEGATNMDAHVLRRQTGTRPKPNRRQTFYQMVMCRLVRRYIHQSKKTMRQDGVNEDDLLEIKQDISSLRYELREDRKREVARTIGHLEGLKRDLLEEIAKQFGLVRQTDLLSNGYLRAEAQKPCDSKFREGASLPGSMVRSEIVEHRPVLQTSLKSEGVFEQVARPADQTKLAVPSLSPKSGQPTFSLSYSRDTQHMYDEIKQLALINSAYDANVSIDDRTIPPYTYMHLKQDILQGVRNELLELLQIPKRSDGEPKLSYPSTKKLDFSTQIKAAPVSPTLPCPSGKGTTVRRTSAQKQGSAPRQLIRQPRQSISPSDPEDGGLVHKTDVVAGTSTSTTHRASKPTEFEETWRREDR
ncbi:transient-receptor-potential-like protein [Clonorchis sinensis]|uniref:Transient-receptor-potential-like protein n=1 Tax=Clonorchis sinensis TaxID=79923 RepID=G7Y433_CLOSI|nr:transient-receptor-potential-like protein [Clonorchis sinensis]